MNPAADPDDHPTDPGGGDGGGHAVSPGRIVLGLAAAVAVGALVVLALGRLAGFGDLGDTFDGARWQWLAVCAVGQTIVFTGYAGTLRRAVAFEGGPSIAPRTSLRIVFASFAMTQLVAAGGAAGLAVTYWAMRRLGFDRRESTVRLLGLNTAVYLAFAGVAWTGAWIALVRSTAPRAMTLAWLLAVPVVVAVARWFTDPQRAGSWERDGGRARALVGTGVAAAAWVRRALIDAGGRRMFIWAAAYWVGDLVSLWAALRAFDASPGVGSLALAYATGYLAQAIPLPLIATGGVDAATTLVLTTVGVPIEAALLGVVAHRVFAFWLPIGPGLWSAAGLARHNRRGEPILTL